MRSGLSFALCICLSLTAAAAGAQQPTYLSPSQPVPIGQAPGMQVKLLNNTPGEKTYAVIFTNGDEALSGLTAFATKYMVGDAHFTAIGATSSATLAWFDRSRKMYRAIPVGDQTEVLSLVGDIATFGGKPIVHMHAVLGRPDGSTVGGHVFALHVAPTLEVFVTAETTHLGKKEDPATDLKLIDPAE